MVSSSRGLAVLVSLGIALVSTLALSFFVSGIGQLAILFGVVFLISGVALYATFELFIFRQINDLQGTMDKLASDLPPGEDREPVSLESLKDLQNELLDFAEKKQEEIDRLKKLETFRREFIADVSHELKTPIFAAQGFLHTLLDGAVNDRNVRMKFLKKAARSLDGLDALVQDLLVLSHIETGQIKMHFETFDIYKLTEEVLEQFEDKVEKKNVGLKIDGTHSTIMVYGDAQRIGQVVTNLVSNAIRHSYEEGEVIVRFDEGRKYVRVSVQDFGEGIPEEHHNRIFERFYRVDKSRTREKGKGGTGLGLAIVKHILEGHSTRAEVESTPGRGSVFSFKLPRYKQESDN